MIVKMEDVETCKKKKMEDKGDTGLKKGREKSRESNASERR